MSLPYLVFHVVGDNDADKECESNHAADEHKQVNEDALSLAHNATQATHSLNNTNRPN